MPKVTELVNGIQNQTICLKFWDSEPNSLFKIDDSGDKGITDIRNGQILAIKIAKRIEKCLPVEGDQDWSGRWSEMKDCCFFLVTSFKSIIPSDFKLWT